MSAPDRGRCVSSAEAQPQAHANGLTRHALVWPTPAGWRSIRCDQADDDARCALARWFAHDWPLVVRRAGTAEAVDSTEVALGLPLPPSLGRRRLTLHLEAAHIARHSPPLALHEIAGAVPAAWRDPVAALVRDARDARLRLDVFGSVAWQCLTGLPYLHEGSDLDLLCYPRAPMEVERALALFEQWERTYVMRADGEIVFPDGAAVSWREWRAAPDPHRLLVKQLDRAMLIERSDLLSRLPVAAQT